MGRTAFVVSCAIFLLPGIVLAGASNATIECNTKYGKSGITLSGSIPGDFAEFELRIKNANGVFDMADNNGTINVITAFDHGVFTIAVTMKDTRNLLLYAIPKTVKAQGGNSREVKARFDAILLEAPKPGYKGPVNYDSVVRDVPLNCSFEHAT